MQLHDKNAQTGKICQSESVSLRSYALKEHSMHHCFLLRNPQCYSDQNDWSKEVAFKRLTEVVRCKLRYIRDSDVLSWQCELKHIRRETLTDSVVIKSIVQSPSYRGSDKNVLSKPECRKKRFLIQKPYLSIQHPFFYTNMTLFAYKCWFCCNWSSCVWAIVPCSISLMPCH